MSEVAATDQQQETRPHVISEKIRVGDDVIELRRRYLCNRCGRYIVSNGDHPECVQEIKMAEAAERERIRQQQCLEAFGEVLNPTEHQRRLYPDYKVNGRESYNEQLRREAAEREQAKRQVIWDRQRRKERLPELERELKILRRAIEKDAEDEAREAAEADTELARIKQEEEAARQAEEQRKRQAEEERRDVIDRVLKRGKYQQ